MTKEKAMPPKPKLIPFQPLCGPVERLSILDIANRFDVERNAVTRAILRLPEGQPLRAKDIPPGDKATAPILHELVSAATRLPLDRWGELSCN